MSDAKAYTLLIAVVVFFVIVGSLTKSPSSSFGSDDGCGTVYRC